MKFLTQIFLVIIIAFALNLLNVNIAFAEDEEQPTIEEGSTISSVPFEPEEQ